MQGKDRRRTLFTTLLDDGYDVIALQETHEAANTPVHAQGGDRPPPAVGDGPLAMAFSEGQQWAREGAGPTRPWPGTAFWAPAVEGSRGVALLFSAKAFPGHQKELKWLCGDSGGNYYALNDPPMEGWICPAMFKYYSEAPQNLYVKAESINKR